MQRIIGTLFDAAWVVSGIMEGKPCESLLMGTSRECKWKESMNSANRKAPWDPTNYPWGLVLFCLGLAKSFHSLGHRQVCGTPILLSTTHFRRVHYTFLWLCWIKCWSANGDAQDHEIIFHWTFHLLTVKDGPVLQGGKFVYHQRSWWIFRVELKLKSIRMIGSFCMTWFFSYFAKNQLDSISIIAWYKHTMIQL